MPKARTPNNRVSVIGALVAIVLAGCGTSSSSSSHGAAASSSSAASSSQGSATGVSIRTAKGPAGTYLVGPSGRALYLWEADSGGQSSCSGNCANVWPPLLTTGSPVASGGAISSDLGTITRDDGTMQVTYLGHPLYYFMDDHSAGTTTGQGSDSYGAKWWLVAPSGSAITTGGSSSASSGGTSAGY
jgi:predicted lipoprotein with Yx(FWY)xxD motif